MRCRKPSESLPVDLTNMLTNIFRYFFLAKSNVSEADNLLDQMTENPCLQVEHESLTVQTSKRFVIYGTCNLEHMFKFVVEQTTSRSCWNMHLSVWNPENNSVEPCQHLPLSDEEYTAHWTASTMRSIQLDAVNDRLLNNVGRKSVWLCSREVFDESEFVRNAGKDHDKTGYSIVNRTRCTCCRKDGRELGVLMYEHFWEAQCGYQRIGQPNNWLNTKVISSVYVAILLFMVIVVFISLFHSSMWVW